MSTEPTINTVPDHYFGLLSKYTVTREEAWRWTTIDPAGLLTMERKRILVTVDPGTYPAATSIAVFLGYAKDNLEMKNRITSWVRHIVTEGKERDAFYAPTRDEQAILDAEARERNKSPQEKLDDAMRAVSEAKTSRDASERQLFHARENIAQLEELIKQHSANLEQRDRELVGLGEALAQRRREYEESIAPPKPASAKKTVR